jgi:hypothetical protein
MKILDNYKLVCPNKACGGTVIEGDELMIPLIQFLNSHNVLTLFSCSGHAYESCIDIYILLAGKPTINLEPPKGFDIEYTNKYSNTIGKMVECLNNCSYPIDYVTRVGCCVDNKKIEKMSLLEKQKFINNKINTLYKYFESNIDKLITYENDKYLIDYFYEGTI